MQDLSKLINKRSSKHEDMNFDSMQKYRDDVEYFHEFNKSKYIEINPDQFMSLDE
jgi:hypothetical protein